MGDDGRSGCLDEAPLKRLFEQQIERATDDHGQVPVRQRVAQEVAPEIERSFDLDVGRALDLVAFG